MLNCFSQHKYIRMFRYKTQVISYGWLPVQMSPLCMFSCWIITLKWKRLRARPFKWQFAIYNNNTSLLHLCYHLFLLILRLRLRLRLLLLYHHLLRMLWMQRIGSMTRMHSIGLSGGPTRKRETSQRYWCVQYSLPKFLLFCLFHSD